MANLGLIISKQVAPVILHFCRKITRIEPNVLLLSAQKSMEFNNGRIIVPNITDIYQMIYFSRNGFSLIKINWRGLPNKNASPLIGYHINLKSASIEGAGEELLTAVKLNKKEVTTKFPTYYCV
jgi:hypothetical protein